MEVGSQQRTGTKVLLLHLHGTMALSGQPQEHSDWLLHTEWWPLGALPTWLLRSCLTSKDPSTSGQLGLLPRSLAELILFWAFQNVLPISLPAAYPSV